MQKDTFLGRLCFLSNGKVHSISGLSLPCDIAVGSKNFTFRVPRNSRDGFITLRLERRNL